jgi:ribosome-binding factor A
MPKDYSRALRIADQIQRDLADLIRNELKDKRVGMITLTGVEVSQDYGHAKVYYTTLGSAEENFLTEKGLQHAAAFLRSQLSQRLRLRVVPLLHFIYDRSIEHGIHLSQLIDKAVEQDEPKEKPA